MRYDVSHHDTIARGVHPLNLEPILKLSSFALCLAAALPFAAAAQNSVTIYGKIDTSVDRVKTGPNSVTAMNNNASRLGFRGQEDLGGGMRALFGVEFAVSPDDGTLGSPPFRNSYVGLSGDYGIVNAGRIDSGAPARTPLYALVTRHTEFVIHDAGTTAVGTSILNSRTRVSNAIAYQSPAISNVIFRAGHYLNGAGLTNVAQESDYRQTDVSLSYGEKDSALTFGAGYGTDHRAGGTLVNELKDKWMLVASYDFGPVRTWALYNRDNYRNTVSSRDAVDVRYVGASVDVGASGKVIANVMTRDVQTNRNAELRRFQIGYLHRLSARTSLYADLDVTDPNNKVGNDRIRAMGLGIVHNF